MATAISGLAKRKAPMESSKLVTQGGLTGQSPLPKNLPLYQQFEPVVGEGAIWRQSFLSLSVQKVMA
jgi:hypothetical protein